MEGVTSFFGPYYNLMVVVKKNYEAISICLIFNE